MSVYCSSFNYLKENSLTNYNLMVATFEPDNGEMDAFLGMEPIYTESYDGTRRIDYGARFNSVATIKITMIKRDHSDFSERDVRKCLTWLTGARANSYLDLVVGDEIKYSFLGRVTGMYQQKMDARTIGLSMEFSSVSPWAYSPVQKSQHEISANTTFFIDNDTEDKYTYVYLKTKYTNTKGNSVVIENTTTGEKTIIDNLGTNEEVTLDNNMMISSSVEGRIFGSDFNYVWPRLQPGRNYFSVYGVRPTPAAGGVLDFEFIYMIKIGDCAIETVQISDPICDEDGNIIKQELEWERITATPHTLAGYGITDGVTMNYLNACLNNITNTAVPWANVTNPPTTLAGYGLSEDAYTKTEIDNQFYPRSSTYTRNETDNQIASAVANLKIDSDELEAKIKAVLT